MLTIRLATQDDVHQMVKVINWGYRGGKEKKAWTGEEHLIQGTRINAELLKAMFDDPALTLIVAEVDGEVVGTIKIDKLNADLAEFGQFAVDPDRQSSGYGGKLLRWAQQYAKEHLNCTSGQVMVISVRDDIIAWYQREGFLKTDEYHDFPPPDANNGVPVGDTKLKFVVLRKASL